MKIFPKSLHYSVLVLLFTFLGTSHTFSQKQKAFIGMLEYKVSARDTSMQKFLPSYSMLIYTNDTIARKENATQQLGTQIEILNMSMNKAYLLLTTAAGKFAIKTDLNKAKVDTTKSSYTFKKKFFRRKIVGIRAKRMLVSHASFEQPIEFLYLKKRANKYNKVFGEIPGLIVKYSIVTADGILDYELIKISEYTPNRDLFGIPSDYKKVSFDEFLDIVTAPENERVIEQ
ncbi:MAG TPA: hypothetical protein EYG86_01575 [Crocinitomicaceae bacterium]|nr:hypothetical protein [Crocinitomicaceae bacterium]